jgi:enamine deaminase RidA (YjgF/YER057c/UK114 family)
MTVQYLNPPGLLRSPAFSQAVVVEQPARTVYVGGQNGVDASGAVVGDLAEQTARAVDNARIALAGAGGQLCDVISWTVAIVAGEDLRAGYGAMQPALADRDAPPIVTVVLVAGLAVPGALVEISAIAVLP